MSQFTVNSKQYNCKKIDAFTQLFISRKTAPMFADMADDLKTVDLLSNMVEDDFNEVLRRIMPFVERQNNAQQWSPIYSKNAGAFLFDDITGGEVLEIFFAVIMQYMPDFFNAVAHLISDTAPATGTPSTPAQSSITS